MKREDRRIDSLTVRSQSQRFRLLEFRCSEFIWINQIDRRSAPASNDHSMHAGIHHDTVSNCTDTNYRCHEHHVYDCVCSTPCMPQGAEQDPWVRMLGKGLDCPLAKSPFQFLPCRAQVRPNQTPRTQRRRSARPTRVASTGSTGSTAPVPALVVAWRPAKIP